MPTTAGSQQGGRRHTMESARDERPIKFHRIAHPGMKSVAAIFYGDSSTAIASRKYRRPLSKGRGACPPPPPHPHPSLPSSPPFSSVCLSDSLSLCSCMFIIMNNGSIIFYLFVYCLSRLVLLLLFSLSIFHLISSLARSSCQTGLNEPKLQSSENKVFEFSLSLSLMVEATRQVGRQRQTSTQRANQTDRKINRQAGRQTDFIFDSQSAPR